MLNTCIEFGNVLVIVRDKNMIYGTYRVRRKEFTIDFNNNF